MKVSPNRFLKAIRDGKQQIGLWVALANPVSAEVIAGAGYDWVVIDMEHSPNDLRSVMAQLQVFAACDTTALVRPDWNDAVLVKRLLDVGAEGLVFPMVQTPDEAARAVAATRYPPRGIRGVGGTTRATQYGRVSDYFTRIEQEICVIAQVETRAALALAVDIGAVDGVDGVFFGPADIAADLGLLGQPMHPAVWDAIRPAAGKLMAAGVPVGTLVFDPVFARQLLAEGFSFVACGTDASLLARAADALLKTMRD